MLKLLTSRLDGRSTLAKRLLCPNPKALDKLTGEYPTASASRQEAIIKQFSALVSGFWIGGSVKLTSRNRLQRVDSLTLESIPEERVNLSMLDVGASDTVTTMDTVAAFVAAGRQLSATAIDRYVYLDCYRCLGWREYRTSAGTPVLTTWLGFGMPLARREHKQKKISKWMRSFYFSAFPRSRLSSTDRIKLQNPLALDADVELIEQDVFEEVSHWHDKFDIVRVSNFLQPNAFTPSQVKTASLLLSNYVKPGGVLVCSRSPGPGEAPGEKIAIFAKQDNGQFRLMVNENGGADAFQTVLEATT